MKRLLIDSGFVPMSDSLGSVVTASIKELVQLQILKNYSFFFKLSFSTVLDFTELSGDGLLGLYNHRCGRWKSHQEFVSFGGFEEKFVTYPRKIEKTKSFLILCLHWGCTHHSGAKWKATNSSILQNLWRQANS
ncbi:hypothetical protein GBA52_006072 [Prunus armeniaca]|nr:hypothetical protein GBA52_006072 [Prunus armeniaca]